MRKCLFEKVVSKLGPKYQPGEEGVELTRRGGKCASMGNRMCDGLGPKKNATLKDKKKK